MSEASREMPRYQSHKEVLALKIKSINEGVSNDKFAELVFEESGYAPLYVSADWFYSRKPQEGGYYVVYKDGYSSFSPAKAFDEGYVPTGGLTVDVRQLMTFYGCSTISELLTEQQNHVKQLQERLKPFLTEPHQINRVREG